MAPRPESHSEKHSVRFQDWTLVKRYHLRPPYPPETFAILSELITDQPRAVLDIGCGTGDIARALLNHADRVDAVDMSLPMLQHGKTLPGGESAALRWIHSRAEDFGPEAGGPYALITAGQSLHWMDWDSVLPGLASLLTPNGVLAIVSVVAEPRSPWEDSYNEIARRFTNNPTYTPVDMIAELEAAGLFRVDGENRTAPVTMKQSVEDYIQAQHSRSNLSLDTLTSDAATRFRSEMVALLTPFAVNGELEIDLVGRVIWGKPLMGSQSVV